MSREGRLRRKEIRETAEALADPRKKTSAIDVQRQGVKRGYARVHPSFREGLREWERVGYNNKIRLSKANTRMWKMAKGSDMSMEEFVEGLSNEELVRGQPYSSDGSFRGRPPMWVPRAFHRACIAELMRRGRKLWQENYLQAIEAMTDIAAGRGKIGAVATPNERIKAAQYVIERLEGKIPEKLVVESDQPWMLVIDEIVADVSDEAVDRAQKALSSAQQIKQEVFDPRDIVDGEIVEEPEPEVVSEPEFTPPPPRTQPRRQPMPKFHRRRAS